MNTSQSLFISGINFAKQGLIDEAITCYDKVISMDCFHTNALWRRAMLKLLCGDYTAWPRYEWLSDPSQKAPNIGWYKRHIEGEMWDGSLLNGRRIYIHHDQGYGDFIHFLRYTNLVKNRGGWIIIECPADIVSVAKTCGGVDETVVIGEKVDYDIHCPLMALPLFFDIDKNFIPYANGYLTIPSQHTEIAEVIEHFSGFRIGVCWKGSSKHAEDTNRSTNLSYFETLRLSGIELFSLQKNEISNSIRNTSLLIRDWADTASAINALDLVVSVDTSVAHLAGALGKPVLLISSKLPDWRWGLAGTNSPWYKSMTIIRQTQLGQWQSVFEEVKKNIETTLLKP